MAYLAALGNGVNYGFYSKNFGKKTCQHSHSNAPKYVVAHAVKGAVYGQF
jgi:hypothetical protein